MFKIKSVSIKNFQSVGNVPQTALFNSNDLILVLGENLDLGGDSSGSRNGCGKTALSNAISFGLYGAAIANVKKENLVNKTNGKNMVVTIDFSVDKDEYRIVRGRRPNILKFYKNNVDQTKEEKDDSAQGDSRETQDEINRILGLSHDMFTHIVGLNTYTIPFLSLRVHEQREIIEQLLGITLLSEKAELLKAEVKKTKEKLAVEEIRVKSIQQANERIQEQINATIRRQKIWLKKKDEDLQEFSSSIEKLQLVDIEQELHNHSLLAEYEEWNRSQQALKLQIKSLEKTIAKDQKGLKDIESDVQTLQEQKCPACEQKLNSSKLESIMNEKQGQLDDLKSAIGNLDLELEDLTNQLEKLGTKEHPEVYYDEISKAYNHKNELDLLIHKLEQRAAEEDPYEEQISEMQKTAIVEVNMDTLNQLSRLIDHQEFLQKLLTNKDSFIRKRIIEQNLAYLNTRLDHYINQMGLPHQVTFMNDLSVTISEYGRDFDFDSLSRGERNRVILSLSWSFRDVWESLYKKINLMFLDELLDNGLDLAGVESAFHLLKDMSRNGRDIWIVSHREELMSRVSNIFKVVKENGFTTFSQD